LHEFLESEKEKEKDNKALGPKDKYDKKCNWISIRKWFLEKIKSWYSSILSDSRFPVNDVTLWDQVYMSATMFKAVLADMCLVMNDEGKKGYIKDCYENPGNIKWRIMGIQYDKLGLAEKGYKPAQINWYRERARRIDRIIKRLIEIKYCLGNEIYRDETGIYFLVGENTGIREDTELTQLHPDLAEVERSIIKIFKCASYEFYPAIFLTKPSRGLMNLTYLLEEAKSNFLKADYPKEFYAFKGVGKSAICPVCKVRAFSASDKKKNEDEDSNICVVCEKRTKNRLKKWIKEIGGETIWTSELQDKNGRIALITLKFELGEWLNGNLTNSLLIRDEEYKKRFEEIEMFFRTFFSTETVLTSNIDCLDEVKNKIDVLITKPNPEKRGKLINNIKKITNKNKELLDIIGDSRKNIFTNSFKLKEMFQAGKYKDNDFEGIVRLFYRDLSELSISVNTLKDNLPDYKKYFTEEDFNKCRDVIDELDINIIELQRGSFQRGSFCLEKLASESYIGCKKNNETFDDWIRQLFFGSIIGNAWEDFVRNSSLNDYIEWDSQRILWDKWRSNEIKFFSMLLLQFVLRKNPSPARLRRIWETTEAFFAGINVIDMAGIKEERCTRFVWNNRNVPDGEYSDDGLLFWAKGNNIYLITPIEKIPKNKKVFNLKPYDDPDFKGKPIAEFSLDEAESQNYKPYFSIMDPTPISWQFIIPAEYIPNLIENITRFYNENFIWVYGKLPLHIGVVIQNYKKPLYLGIKALRKIRRDNVEEIHLKRKIKAANIKFLQDKFTKEIEQKNDTGNYYSLYETAESEGCYQFYLNPHTNGLKWLRPVSDICDNKNIVYYPNTFDFEFLDTNTRRNEIFYIMGRRKLTQKKNRPYTLEEANKLLGLGKVFASKAKENTKTSKSKTSATQMHNFITQLYSKYESWNIENDDQNIESFKLFLITSLVNTLKLNTSGNENLKNKIAEVLEVSDIKELQDKSSDEIRWITKLFFDSYEFWHKALKEVFKNEGID
jgi:hypothetical protein